MRTTTVKSYYVTRGPVRGSCGHKHRYFGTALDCLEADRKGCRGQGGYSDRTVFHTRRLLTEAEQTALDPYSEPLGA